MKKIYLLTTLLSVTLLTARCQQKEKMVIKSATFTTTQDDPGPPPASVLDSKPVTLKQWFFKLCDEHDVGGTNLSYKFDFWETSGVYQIGLIKLSKFGKDVRQNYEAENIKPNGKFYAILKSDYKDLKWKQILDKIKSQLKEYSQTEKFKQSYFAKAKSISIKFDDNDVINLK